MPPTGRPRAGPVAQWLEPAAHNGLVAGSSPARPTRATPRGREIEVSQYRSVGRPSRPGSSAAAMPSLDDVAVKQLVAFIRAMLFSAARAGRSGRWRRFRPLWGSFNETEGVLSEFGASLGYQFGPDIELRAGYHFLSIPDAPFSGTMPRRRP